MLNLWLALAVQIATIIANRLTLQRMRAEMATTEGDKKAAIDEGLKVDDALHTFLDKVRGKIESLTAPAALPVVPVK